MSSSRKRSRRNSEGDRHNPSKRQKDQDEEEKVLFENMSDHANEEKNKYGFPLNKDGTTLHLGVKKGDVANRILSVGDTARAIKISKFFDKPDEVKVTESKLSFKVFTGTFKGVPISIAATGMGYAMIDFVVREIRHVVDGPLSIIRLGTCGVIHPDYDAGQVLIATKGSTFIQTNHCEILKGNHDKAYSFAPPAKSDIPLSSLLVCNMRNAIGKDKVKQVMNCSADSFYCSEGRIDPNFVDLNDTLIDDLQKAYPHVVSLEMETFGLLSLAKSNDMHCTACAIGLIHQRVLPTVDYKGLEDMAGLSILKTLAAFEFPEGEPEFTDYMKDVLYDHAVEQKGEPSPLIGIERILEKHPEYKDELRHIDFDE